jgi:hypothetical protein
VAAGFRRWQADCALFSGEHPSVALVANDALAPPVPIPHTVVKQCCAYNTAPRGRDDRSLPAPPCLFANRQPSRSSCYVNLKTTWMAILLF